MSSFLFFKCKIIFMYSRRNFKERFILYIPYYVMQKSKIDAFVSELFFFFFSRNMGKKSELSLNSFVSEHCNDCNLSQQRGFSL